MLDAKIDSGWSEIEFQDLSLGDKRLDKRLRKIAEQLSGKLQAPIYQAAGDWASAQAAYRLFENEKVKPEGIFSCHRERTKSRIEGESLILAIQDTTHITFSHGKSVEGLGLIGDRVSDARGLILHHTLATTAQGLPLGFLTQDIWTREGYNEQGEYESWKRPIEEKESNKWLEALRETAGAVPETTKVITVCDREADIYEFLQEATKLGSSILVRASADRRLENAQEQLLFERLSTAEVLGTIELSLPRYEKRERTAQLEVRLASVILSPPRRPKGSALTSLKFSAILVKEINCPAKEIPLEWKLITNVPTVSFEDAVERIRWYRSRWLIEVLHRILKTGCEVERCLLESVDGLAKYLSLFCVIAWRIFWLTYIARIQPNASADLVLSQHEQMVLQCFVKPSNRPSFKHNLSTAKEVVLAIAMLGGFLNRKNDGKPGPTPIWRGWQYLQYMALNFDQQRADAAYEKRKKRDQATCV